MLRTLDRYLSARADLPIAALSFLLVAVIGSADHLTGYELSFSIFYLMPVALGSWYGGRRLAAAICLVSASMWLAVDFTTGHPYSNPLIPLWNAGVRLGFFLIVSYLLRRLRGAFEAQARLAQMDGLTGTLNARSFIQRCRAMFQLAARHGHPVALGYLDLDGFKAVNDRLGHAVGDQVLKAVAGTMAGRLRGSDLLARLGGDEFAILLPETDLAGARTFFRQMHEILRRLAADSRWPIGFSFGVIVLGTVPEDPELVIRYADQLMYRVKGAGKDDVLVEEFAGDWDGVPADR